MEEGDAKWNRSGKKEIVLEMQLKKKKNKKWSETSLNECLFQGIVLIPRQKTKKILTERHLLDLETGI